MQTDRHPACPGGLPQAPILLGDRLPGYTRIQIPTHSPRDLCPCEKGAVGGGALPSEAADPSSPRHSPSVVQAPPSVTFPLSFKDDLCAWYLLRAVPHPPHCPPLRGHRGIWKEIWAGAKLPSPGVTPPPPPNKEKGVFSFHACLRGTWPKEVMPFFCDEV